MKNENNVSGNSSTEDELLHIEDKYKTLGRRFFAGMLDASVVGVASICCQLCLLFANVQLRYPIFRITLLLISILYPIITTKILGGTFGKIYFNVFVRKQKFEEKSISWIQSILREFLNILAAIGDASSIVIFYFLMNQTHYIDFIKFRNSSLIFGIFGILFIFMFLLEIVTALGSKRRRSIHDFIGGTVVVKNGPYRRHSRTFSILAFSATTVIILLLSKSLYY